ncbi:hypothetical protein BC938DRAFT_479390, partial [Jimgerdemannia flammicorona]
SEKALFQFSEGLVPVLRRPCSSSPKALFQFSEDLVPVLRRPCSVLRRSCSSSQKALFQFSEGLDLILRRETKHPLSDTKGIYYLIDGFGALNTTLLNDFLASLKSCIGKQRAHCRKMLPAALIFSTNISSKRTITGLYGLSRQDIRAALRLPGMYVSGEIGDQLLQYPTTLQRVPILIFLLTISPVSIIPKGLFTKKRSARNFHDNVDHP